MILLKIRTNFLLKNQICHNHGLIDKEMKSNYYLYSNIKLGKSDKEKNRKYY